MNNNNNLDDRVKREKQSYDEGNVYEESNKLQRKFLHVFQCQNTMEGEFYLNQVIKEETGKGTTILDYGCYDGKNTPKLLENGAKKVIGIDISENAIKLAQKKFGHLNTEFIAGDAHHTRFQDETFDFIVGGAILHHLDYQVAINEIYRLLKPGGKALFIEPLGDNPEAKLIRLLTPKSRTKDESPLSAKQIIFSNNLFGKHHHKFINLLTVPVAMLTSQTSLKADNPFTKCAHKLDLLLSRTFLKYWMRQVILCWEKV